MPSHHLEDWEKTFEILLKDYADNVYYEGDPLRTKGTHESDLKSFIRSKFSSLQQKIEGMKKKHKETCMANKDGYGYKFRDCDSDCQSNGYNKALEDVLALFKKDI